MVVGGLVGRQVGGTVTSPSENSRTENVMPFRRRDFTEWEFVREIVVAQIAETAVFVFVLNTCKGGDLENGT